MGKDAAAPTYHFGRIEARNLGVTARATIKVLTSSGYQVAQKGDNGFVCVVMRGWSAPTFTPAQFRDLVYDTRVRAPICFNPVAALIEKLT